MILPIDRARGPLHELPDRGCDLGDLRSHLSCNNPSLRGTFAIGLGTQLLLLYRTDTRAVQGADSRDGAVNRQRRNDLRITYTHHDPRSSHRRRGPSVLLARCNI